MMSFLLGIVSGIVLGVAFWFTFLCLWFVWAHVTEWWAEFTKERG